MDIFKNFINEYGSTILYTFIAAVAGYIGTAIKNAYMKHMNDKTKENVVKTCVKAIEQIYSHLEGEEKLNKCVESSIEMLNEKSISISELELKMLIEAAVTELN